MGVVKIRDDEIFERLDDVDMAIIEAYAASGMSVSRTARRAHYDRRTVSNRLTNIRLRVGVDPRDFKGLCQLIKLIEEKGETNG